MVQFLHCSLKVKKMGVLCKYKGMLVIAEVSLRTDGEHGHCPECNATSFYERYGWTECDCGFAYLTAHLKKLGGSQCQ